MAGRDREVDLLLQAVRDPPALVLIEGEAGIGKSRLVHELSHHAARDRRRLLVGHCHRLADPHPLAPVLEALAGARHEPPSGELSPLAGVLRPLLPELMDHFPAALEPLAQPRAEHHRVLRALRELLGALGPTICVLEDVQWADAGTLELLPVLAAVAPRELALVLTSRPDGIDARSAFARARGAGGDVSTTTIVLAPLGVDDVAALACNVLDVDRISASLAVQLHARTAGNPLAVVGLTRLLADRGDLQVAERWPVKSLDELGVPRTISDAVQEEMQASRPVARRIAMAAAVLGEPADEELLKSVAGLAAVRARTGLSENVGAGLLAVGLDGYGFRHELAAAAAYDAVPEPERRHLHVRAARALEASPEPRPLARIAHHFKAGERTRQWVRYAEAAAVAARSTGDEPSATAILEEALLAPGLPRAARVRMAIGLGMSAVYGGPRHVAIELLQRTLDEERLPAGVRGELRFALCRLRSHAGDTDSWRAEMLLAVEELRRRPALSARAMANLALPTRLTEDGLADHLEWLRRAERTASRRHDPVARTAVAAQRAVILLSTGDSAAWAAADEIPAGAETIDEKMQLLRGYSGLTRAALGLGHNSQAERFFAEAERVHAQLEHRWWSVWLEWLQVALDHAAGQWDGLETRARRCGNQVVLASLLLARGEPEKAAEHLNSVLHWGRATRFIPDTAIAAGLLARVHLRRHDPQEARRIATEAVEPVRRKGIWVWAAPVAADAVDALLACNARDEAGGLVRELAIGLRGRDAPAASAALACCRGALAEADGRHRIAARAFATEERTWLGLPDPHAAARARARRGRCLLRAGDPRGEELLLASLRSFDELGARWDGAHVRADLRAEGVALPYPWRGGRRRYEDVLSPREREVAHLAALGRTNREIAEVLVLSPRTVAHHVSSILRKLRVDSRRGLVAHHELADDQS